MDWRRIWMLLGFIAALTGDWFLAIKCSPRSSIGFLWGVLAFSCAHLCWMMGQLREARPLAKAATALGIPLLLFTVSRIAPLVPATTGIFLGVYSVITAINMATALATRRRWYLLGIWFLALSDVFIGGSILGAPGYGMLIGPFYITAEVFLLISFFSHQEPRFDWNAGNAFRIAVTGGSASVLCFLLGMAMFPGGGFNPAMRMLSCLGRTALYGIEWPFCHYAFITGMVIAALTVARASVPLLDGLPSAGRKKTFAWGMALNVAGLLAIAATPEDRHVDLHVFSVFLAAAGGGLAVLAHDRPGRDRRWTMLLFAAAGIFLTLLGLHTASVLRFAPWLPSMQKVFIALFVAWFVALARRAADASARREAGAHSTSCTTTAAG